MSRCEIVGSRSFEDIFSEVYYTFLLGFQAILKRVAYKDLINYKIHNDVPLNYKWFSTSISFNLFSEYGIGKSLQPLLVELMKKYKLDYEKYHDNIFFQEIVLICPDITGVLRKKDAVAERDWAYEYATNSLFIIDGIAQERIDRLFPLFQDFEDSREESEEDLNSEEERTLDQILEELEKEQEEQGKNKEVKEIETIEDEEIEDKPCQCSFCLEFEKYIYDDERHIEEVIVEAIRNIS